jgi:FixJ family two-component response regulator
MDQPQRDRILIVDDEEAILETMQFTFEDDYDVLTSPDAEAALRMLDTSGGVSVVMSDQRMPNMTGVEFLTKVFEAHPETVRIILTGFADMDAIIQAINDGHVYAYITKPWEPEDLKQVVRRAVDHHGLTVENDRLLQNLARSNILLEGVMERLDQGALAVDADGVVQASNTLARQYLGQSDDPRGRRLEEVLCGECLDELRTTTFQLAADEDASHADLELDVGGVALRMRVTVRNLSDPSGASLGTVVFFREISHEPQRRRFDDLVGELLEADGEIRAPMETAVAELRALGDELRGSSVSSPGKDELRERSARTVTALENWLSIDDSLAREDYPDAQLLQDRLRVALARWPRPDGVPVRVRELASRVEAYYDSGENPKQRTL